MQYIPYGRQSIDEDDIKEVVKVLRSDFITQGPRVNEFEAALCDYTGVRYAVAVSSGTAALYLAARAAAIRAGDEVITVPITFIASANCAVHCGARPVFADIDPRTYIMSPPHLAGAINTRTKAVIPVHFAGQSCDMEAIHTIVREKEARYGRKIYIIEDAAHALGSVYKGKPVGSCTYSDMAIFSFHPVKHITTGEGGAILTNDEHLCRTLQKLRNHGITTNAAELVDTEHAYTDSVQNPWYYEQQTLGYNFRVTDIQCALGCSQLRKLPAFIKQRKAIVARYNEAFHSCQHITIPYESGRGISSWHLYVALFDFASLGITRLAMMQQLQHKGIRTQVHYIPVHTHPFFRERFGTQWGDCPVAEKFYTQCLTLPLYPGLSNADVVRVIDAVTAAINTKKVER